MLWFTTESVTQLLVWLMSKMHILAQGLIKYLFIYGWVSNLNSFRLLAQTTLRNILGTKTLSEVLSERESIAIDLKSMIDTATDPWGIDVS